MIDINNEQDVLRIAQKLEEHSREYWSVRKTNAKFNHAVEILLASKMPEFRKVRSNIGYDTARVMLLETKDEEIINIIKGYSETKAECDGLAKVCDALQSQISLVQSLIKNRRNLDI